MGSRCRGGDQVRARIVEIACDMNGRALLYVPVVSLQTLASNAYWGQIKICADITRVANIIHDSRAPEAVKRRLVQIAGEALQRTTLRESSLELVMEIARARVMHGAGCLRVVMEQGLNGMSWKDARVRKWGSL